MALANRASARRSRETPSIQMPTVPSVIVPLRDGAFERNVESRRGHDDPGITQPLLVVGSLAGNVLKRFRVELDYAHETLHRPRP
jgi:hypothetical protein